MADKKGLCLVAGSSPTYRKEIFNRLGNDLGCDYILGAGPTRQMNIKELPGNLFEIKTKKKWNAFYIQPGALKYSANYRYLILDLGYLSLTEWAILIRSKFRKQKTFIWTHGWYGTEGFFKRILKRLYFSLCTDVLVYGDRAKSLMIQNGCNPQKIFAIHNSLAYSEQLPLRQQMVNTPIFRDHFGNDHNNIIFIGRLRENKKLYLLIEALSELKQRGEVYNATFIGDGESRERMKEMISKLGIQEQIWFYGECFDEKKNAELIYNADLCVSPGNIGLTAMHVLMFGCPAITNDDFNTQMPEFEAIHEGETGGFFRVNDSKSLADAISKWFSTHKDDRNIVRESCYEEIDKRWNPEFQIGVIGQVLKKEGYSTPKNN